ncbi:MAG TPA: SGNH/GDSL hydrolase family protein [Acidimicrobiia bacterium]
MATARLRAALARVSALTALGDSVPYGTACNCTPYPQLTAADVASIAGHAVKDFDDAVPGYLSNDVLRQLQSNPSAIADVQKADAVMIEVGANDIAFSSTCGTNISCYESRLPQVTTNITAIVSRVRQLTAGRHITIVVLDYWSVWLGGRYAQTQGPAYVDAASSLTHAFSGAIRSIALTTGSLYVDLRTAFRGPDDDRDETTLLASDGDHPDAEGQERIADAILQTLATV